MRMPRGWNDKGYAQFRIDAGNQFVVEMCHENSLRNASIHLLGFCFVFDSTGDCCSRGKPKEWCDSIVRKSWQLPNCALHKLESVSSSSGILISRHKSAWFK
jgi:hypothetical protein